MYRRIFAFCFLAIAQTLFLSACSKKPAPTIDTASEAIQTSTNRAEPAAAKCTSMYDDCPFTLVHRNHKPSAEILKSQDVEAMENTLYDYIASMDMEPIRSLREAAENGGITEKEAYAVQVLFGAAAHHYMKKEDAEAALTIIMEQTQPQSAEANFWRAVLVTAKDNDETEANKYFEAAIRIASSEKHGKLLAELLEHGRSLTDITEFKSAFNKADEIYSNLKEIYKDGVAKKDPEAMYRLAAATELYQLAKNERTAKTPYSGELLQQFTDAANAGQRDAMMRLGVNLAKDEATWPQAFDWLSKAADKGEETALSVVFNLYADTILYNSYEEGVSSGQMDDSVTPRQFEIAKATMGSVHDGMRKIAQLLINLKGQALGHCESGMSLAEYIHDHPDEFGQDAKALEADLKDSALQCMDDFAQRHGFMEACKSLLMLMMGDYLDSDDAERMHERFSQAQIQRMFDAVKQCYTLAVASDDVVFDNMPYHIPPSSHLASLYGAHSKQKYDIDGDPVEEIALLVYGARHGDPNSLGILAHFYAQGNTVPQNKDRACYWWQKGMDIDLCKACRVLNDYEPEEGDPYCYACGVIETEHAGCVKQSDNQPTAP